MLDWYKIGWKTYVADTESGHYVINYKHKDVWMLFYKAGDPPQYLPPYKGPDYGDELVSGRTHGFCVEYANLHAIGKGDVWHERSARLHYNRAIQVKSPTSYRLSDMAKDMLRDLAGHHGLNITNTLELVIREAHREMRREVEADEARKATAEAQRQPLSENRIHSSKKK